MKPIPVIACGCSRRCVGVAVFVRGYPAKPVRIVVSCRRGSNDVVARVRPAADGKLVRRSLSRTGRRDGTSLRPRREEPPDGYHILQLGHPRREPALQKLPYDPMKVYWDPAALRAVGCSSAPLLPGGSVRSYSARKVEAGQSPTPHAPALHLGTHGAASPDTGQMRRSTTRAAPSTSAHRRGCPAFFGYRVATAALPEALRPLGSRPASA